jgi:hypothetical protein
LIGCLRRLMLTTAWDMLAHNNTPKQIKQAAAIPAKMRLRRGGFAVITVIVGPGIRVLKPEPRPFDFR